MYYLITLLQVTLSFICKCFVVSSMRIGIRLRIVRYEGGWDGGPDFVHLWHPLISLPCNVGRCLVLKMRQKEGSLWTTYFRPLLKLRKLFFTILGEISKLG